MELQAATPPLVLASASVARAALLRAAGLQFAAVSPTVDEQHVKAMACAVGWSAEQTAARLAERKAAEVSARRPDAVVIGADQMLVCGGVWFDKPDSLDGARAQLRALRGRTHRLITAVTCRTSNGAPWRHLAIATL